MNLRELYLNIYLNSLSYENFNSIILVQSVFYDYHREQNEFSARNNNSKGWSDVIIACNEFPLFNCQISSIESSIE